MEQKTIEIPAEFKRLFDDDWREAAVYGGRFSLKSHTVARVLLLKARLAQRRVACFREFQNSIAESSHQLLADLIKKYDLKDFTVTDHSIVNSLTGSDFLFKGLWHNEQSIKSIEGIDIAWVEEAQTISEQSLEVLTPTVRKAGSQIIYTYNRLREEDPVHKRLVLDGRPNTLIINVNYDIALKYGWMPVEVQREMEDDKARRPAVFRHKWLGEPNTVEGRVYQDWNTIDEIPHEARLERRGLDFGYSNDPAAVVDIYYYNGGYIFDEQLYRKGMHNKPIADLLNNLPNPQTLVIADSAEPKSIDEMRLYGVNILPAQKGPGSVTQGIQYVQDQRISVTKRSVNLMREYRSYLWEFDKDGKQLAVPEEGLDHCFAPDTQVHTLWGKRKIKDLEGTSGHVWTRGGKLARYSDVRPTRTNAETVRLTFDDGQTLEVTPDHLLLKPNGEWIEAGLLKSGGLIQSVMYEGGRNKRKMSGVQWRALLPLRQVFFKLRSLAPSFAPGGVAVPQLASARGLSHPPHRSQPLEQSDRQFDVYTGVRAPQPVCERRGPTASPRTHQSDSAPYKSLARLYSGAQVAHGARQKGLRTAPSDQALVRSLPQRLRDYAICCVGKILSSELQDESPTKEITGIARGFQAVTYNMEVQGTHCLFADGVIAHNCLDAIRYGMESLRPKDKEDKINTGNVGALWY